MNNRSFLFTDVCEQKIPNISLGWPDKRPGSFTPPRKNPPIPIDLIVRPRVRAISHRIQINCMGNKCPQMFLAISLPSPLM